MENMHTDVGVQRVKKKGKIFLSNLLVLIKALLFFLSFHFLSQLSALDTTESLQSIGLYPQETIFVEER